MPESSAVGMAGAVAHAVSSDVGVSGSDAEAKRAAELAMLRPTPSSYSKQPTRQGMQAWTIVVSIMLLSASAYYAEILPAYAVLLSWAAAGELTAIALDVTSALVRKANSRRRVDRDEQQQHQERRTDGVYTWQQVAMHNTPESAWIAVKGKVYDVTDFVDSHPGGRELLLLCCGRDATDLFLSYHPFTNKPALTLNKYLIGTLSTYEHPMYPEDTGLYRELCSKVGDYFKQTKLDHKAPLTAFLRMTPAYAVGFLAFYVAYLTPLSAPETASPYSVSALAALLAPETEASWRASGVVVRVLAAVLFGIGCQGIPLTGWMHDSSHASIGHSEWLWFGIGRFALDWVSGSSMVSWRNQHVIGHHVYTNVMGADPDLPVATEGDVRRIVPEQVWNSVYKYQHVYMPILYGLLGLKSRFQDTFEIFKTHLNGPIRVNPISTQDNVRQFASKSFWMFFRFVMPHVFFGKIPLSLHVMLFFVSEFTTGYWLAFNFQVSHVTTVADFYFSDVSMRDEKPVHTEVRDEWAVSQVKSTIDYGQLDPIATYLSGGLNYQTAHHLFPTVSQYHYPKITPIIMDVCEKYGVHYNALPSFYVAFAGHVAHLKAMGEQGKCPELKLE